MAAGEGNTPHGPEGYPASLTVRRHLCDTNSPRVLPQGADPEGCDAVGHLRSSRTCPRTTIRKSRRSRRLADPLHGSTDHGPDR
ncbi:hypothetical protein D3093_35590 (plasmid) [Azospirillum argentinense]|uniref:Uncharacterized protein n=2 Tax=Azospirillum TaxID=191 RepID=A0A4D8QEQ8_AZOBR|nr:hypothetical protein D3093_35590 [Azospirillum argentinense]QCO07406.1 hypothetical protein D3867_36650 [Azospirillum argentinense]